MGEEASGPRVRLLLNMDLSLDSFSLLAGVLPGPAGLAVGAELANGLPPPSLGVGGSLGMGVAPVAGVLPPRRGAGVWAPRMGDTDLPPAPRAADPPGVPEAPETPGVALPPAGAGVGAGLW